MQVHPGEPLWLHPGLVDEWLMNQAILEDIYICMYVYIYMYSERAEHDLYHHIQCDILYMIY
jgi:hypothetical protein